MGAVDSQVLVPLIENSTNYEPHMRSSKRLPKTNFYTNAWKLVESEFHSLKASFSLTYEASCDPDGSNRHDLLLPFYSGKDSFLTRDIAGQSVYNNPSWFLAAQCIKKYTYLPC